MQWNFKHQLTYWKIPLGSGKVLYKPTECTMPGVNANGGFVPGSEETMASKNNWWGWVCVT